MSSYKVVFLVGAGRSGTKFLRDLLANSDQIHRIPFDIGYLWRYGNEGLPHDEITPSMVSEEQLAWMRKTLPKLIDKDCDKPNATMIIEKSVPNALRPELLYKAFPDAKFIHLVRDGYAVAESARRMWLEPPKTGYLWQKIRYFPWANYRYAFWFVRNLLFKRGASTPIWGPRYKGIQEDVKSLPLHVVCAKQWARCIELSSAQLAAVPADQLLTVKYEALTQDAEKISEIARFVGLDEREVVSQWREDVRPENANKWKEVLTESEIAEIGTIFRESGLDKGALEVG